MATKKKAVDEATVNAEQLLKRAAQWKEKADKAYKAVLENAQDVTSKFYDLTLEQAVALEDALDKSPEWRRVDDASGSVAYSFVRDPQTAFEDTTTVTYRARYAKASQTGMYLNVVGTAKVPGQDTWKEDAMQTEIAKRNRLKRAAKRSRNRARAFADIGAAVL